MQAFFMEAVSALRNMHIPSLPEEVIKLKQELTAKYPNTVTVANLISRNPEMYNHFLKLVNSNLTETDEPIQDAQAAVNILGLDEIFNIFLASTFSKQIAVNEVEKEVLRFGALAGIAAAELSPWVGGVSRSEAYLAALSQNIGAVFLMRLDREGYADIFFKQLSYPFTAHKKEADLMMTTHAYAGVIVAKKWEMSADIYQTILLHHDEMYIGKTANHPKVRHLVALTMMANYLITVNLGESFVTQEVKRMRQLAQRVLTLSDNALKSASRVVLKAKKSADKI